MESFEGASHSCLCSPKITRLKRYLNLKSFRKGKEVLLSIKSSMTTLHYIISINILSSIIRDAFKGEVLHHHTSKGSTQWVKPLSKTDAETMFALPLVTLDPSVCQLQAGIIWLMVAPRSFRSPPWGKIQMTSLIIPDVATLRLLPLVCMTFHQQSEQQGPSLLQPKLAISRKVSYSHHY